MSFDLYFCREDGPTPAIQELREYFTGLPLFQVSDGEDGSIKFWYGNAATGVYCGFSYSPLDANELEGCGSSGLSFNLNFIRPSFFAYETMPLVEAFCQRFDLMVEDPQEQIVQRAEGAQLIKSWRAHNANAVGALVELSKTEKVDLHYLPEPEATEWWRYMSIRQRIEDTLTEDMFVPSVIRLRSPAGRIFTMIVWPSGIAQFFPRCDYVYVKRETKRLFGTKQEAALIAYDSVKAAAGTLLDTYEFEGVSVKYLRPEKMALAVQLVGELPLQPVDLAQHTQIASDGFHDVALGENDIRRP